jgi:putative NADH-flavin reductase
MRITVFGASGNTGRKVVELGIAQGHEMVAVARRTYGTALPKTVIPCRGGVLDPPSVERAIASSDIVISCIGPLRNLTPATLMSKGVTNIVEACERAGIRRFVFQSGILMTDGSKLSPANRIAIRILRLIFAASIRDKAIAESAIQRSRIDWVILRPAGPPAVARFTAGPRAHITPFLALPFVNCAEALLRAATEPAWSKQIINIGR